MKRDSTGCRAISDVDRHFAGKLHPDEERRLRGHLPECDACHRRYRRHLLWAKYDPRALSPQERLGRGLGLRLLARARWLSPRTLAPALAIATVLLWFAARPNQPAPEFQARGATASAPEFWAFRIARGETAPLGEALADEDELAFAYFVPAEADAAKYLLVFGVDEHRHVYWYHPAWIEADAAPSSVPVSVGRHELPEAVAHDFDGRELTLYAVFAADPVSVRDVESAIKKGDPAFTGRAVWSRNLRVSGRSELP